MKPNPLIRLVISFIGISVLLVSFVHDHLKLMDCQSDLAKTVETLELTTFNLNQCLDVRDHDQALTRQAISAAQDCQRILHEQMQFKTEPSMDEALTNDVISLSTNLWKAQETAFLMDYKSMVWMTNRADLVNLSRNGQTILTVDPNFNVLVHGTKIGRITETNFIQEP